MSSVSEPPESPTEPMAGAQLHGRLVWGMAMLFVIIMATVTLAVISAGDSVGGAPLLVRLVLIAVVIPAAMAGFVLRVMRPARALEAMAEQLRTLYSEARLDALLDPISGLGNHRAFQEELHRQIEAAARHRHSVALAIIDLDDLKRVNDAFGHAGGDQLLAAVGRLLVSGSRTPDRAYRIGGDEFALLMPHASADDAYVVIHRILASALSGETTFAHPFSFSGGVSAFPEPSRDGRSLQRSADAALYYAKRHGRTDVQVFDAMRHGVVDDGRSAAELAEAIDRVTVDRALTPVYQPIFDLVSGEVVGFEGLVRPFPGSEFRDASSLFTAAEVAERTVELDMLAIETIVAGVGDGLGARYLSVNVSPRSLETEFPVATLVTLLHQHGLEPDRIVLELTEREAVEDMDALRANLDRCRDAGFRIAADDVGAGNAGLRLLSEVVFDIVKIDLSLVQGGVLRDPAIAVLRGIQSMAAQSNASVVAEGIETVEQLEAIRRLSISSGQGYLLAVPTPHATSLRIDVDLLVESHRARRHAILESWELPQDVAAWGISGDRIAFRPAEAESAERQPPEELIPPKAPASQARARKPRAPRTASPAKVARPASSARVRRPRPAA
jgi:diguanylate cyclase (GGDEF)-like protein